MSIVSERRSVVPSHNRLWTRGTIRRRIFLLLYLLHLSKELRAQLVDEGLHLVGHFRRNVLLDFQEGAAVASAVGAPGALSGPQQPIGNVDVIQEVLRGRFLLQNVGDGHIEAGDAFEPNDPFVEAIDIRQ